MPVTINARAICARQSAGGGGGGGSLPAEALRVGIGGDVATGTDDPAEVHFGQKIRVNRWVDGDYQYVQAVEANATGTGSYGGLTGMQFGAYANNPGAGLDGAQVFGIYGIVGGFGARDSQFTCIAVGADFLDCPRATVIGIRIPPASFLLGDAGASSTQIGIQIDDLNTAGTSYAIKTGLGPVLFGDRVDAPNLVPQVQLRAESYVEAANRDRHVIVCDAEVDPMTVTLPPAAGNGAEFTFKRLNAGGNAVTIAAASGETIDGASTYVLGSQWQRVTLVSDGSGWLIVA